MLIGVAWAWTAFNVLEGSKEVSFSRHWGGLGSGQGGWEASGPLVSALMRLVFSAAVITLGAGLLWPSGDASSTQPSGSATGGRLP